MLHCVVLVAAPGHHSVGMLLLTPGAAKMKQNYSERAMPSTPHFGYLITVRTRRPASTTYVDLLSILITVKWHITYWSIRDGCSAKQSVESCFSCHLLQPDHPVLAGKLENRKKWCSLQALVMKLAKQPEAYLSLILKFSEQQTHTWLQIFCLVHSFQVIRTVYME